MTQPLVPAKAPDTAVLRGNPWTQPVTLPAEDAADNPLDWSGSTFNVTSEQTDLIALEVIEPTSLLLTLSGEHVETLPRYVHWYLADDVVMNDTFLTGRITVKDRI